MQLAEPCLGKVIAELDAGAEKTGVIQELPGTSTLDALRPRIDGDVPFVNIDAISPIVIREGLDLLRGSADLTSIEDDIAAAHTQRFAARTKLMRTYVAIGNFLVRLGAQRKYDYIFIDLGPGSGALTRAFFLACNVFFVPVAPDRFNVQAIKTLSSIGETSGADHGFHVFYCFFLIIKTSVATLSNASFIQYPLVSAAWVNLHP